MSAKKDLSEPCCSRCGLIHDRDFCPKDEIERIKRVPAVEAALNEYAMRIKRWGVDDNTPHQLIEAENEAIRQILAACQGAR